MPTEMPPAPVRRNRIISPTTWVLAAVTVLVALGITALGLTGNNSAITSPPATTTGIAPATPPSLSKDAIKTDRK